MKDNNSKTTGQSIEVPDWCAFNTSNTGAYLIKAI